MAEDLLTEPLDYRDGHLHPPHRPGLGITLDEDKIRRFARA
jgi:muconate cycloisomerase